MPAATQATATKQPIFRSNVLKGLPVVRFDGVDDEMEFTFPSTSSQYTVCMVIAFDSATQGTDKYDYIWSTKDLNNSVMGLARRASNDSLGHPEDLYIYSNNSVDQIYWDGDMGNTAFHLITYTHNAGAQTLRVDRVAQTLTSQWGNGNPSMGHLFRLGSLDGANFFGGDIAEYIVYERLLTSAEIDQVETYLYDKWLGP